MPVFDFSTEKKEAVNADKTYELVYSNERAADKMRPIMVLDNSSGQLKHHSSGYRRKCQCRQEQRPFLWLD